MEMFELYVDQVMSKEKTPHFDFSIVKINDDYPPKILQVLEDVSDDLQRILNNILLLHYQYECSQFQKWYESLNFLEKAYYYCSGDLVLPSKILGHDDMPSYYQASTGIYIMNLIYKEDGKNIMWLELKNCRQNQIN